MAREDTRWFVAGVVILSLVLFLALPLAVLIVIDNMKLQAQLRQEIRDVRKLKQEVRKEVKDVANSRGDRIEPDK